MDMAFHSWEVIADSAMYGLRALVWEFGKPRQQLQAMSFFYVLPHSSTLLDHFHPASCSLQDWIDL